MVEFKIVISDPKTGKSYQQEIKDDAANQFLNKKIGEKIKGELLDMTGYEFVIKGGSDDCGFPMRWDVNGQGRKQIFIVSGVGVKRLITKTKKGDRKIRRKSHGVKQRKTVCGNIIHEGISQINLMVLKHGPKPLGGEEVKEGAEAKAEKPAETKALVEKKEVPKEEKKPQEKKETPKETPKVEKPAEKKEEKAEKPKEDKPEEKK